MNVKFIDLKPLNELLALELDYAYYDVVDSNNFIGGSEVERFEKKWAEYCEAEYCVGVGNGHDALALACRCVSSGNDNLSVRVPWKTCLPTWAAVRNGGCHPSPYFIESNAYIAVHIYGEVTLPDNYDKAILIEDCAQAHGSKQNGIMAGKFGKVAAWSFYPTKNLGALGDAGAVTTDDPEIYETIRCLREYGARDYTGINSRLDPLQASFLLVKLKYLDEWNARRKENAQSYLENIVPNGKVQLPHTFIGSEPNWHIFAIETDERDSLKMYLAGYNIETKIHYPNPPYPTYWHIQEAEDWARRTLSLPIAPHVTPDICKNISWLINEWMGA